MVVQGHAISAKGGDMHRVSHLIHALPPLQLGIGDYNESLGITSLWLYGTLLVAVGLWGETILVEHAASSGLAVTVLKFDF